MRRAFSGSVAVWVVTGLLTPSWAELSQTPMLASSAAQVPPNLMFTLDDSGSMDFECLPDALCVGGPSNQRIGTVPWGVDNTWKYGAAEYTEALFPRRMRSAAINPLYYNPAVRYRPWLLADGTRRVAYPASAAVVNVLDSPVQTVNLTTDATQTTLWCSSLDSCTTGSRTFFPAVYYSLTTGVGANVNDFTRVEIRPGSTYPRSSARTDCTSSSSTCSYEEEIQNFSNWFTYARTRMRVAIAGTSEAFAVVPSSFRVGFGTINSPVANIDGISTKTLRQGVRPFTGSDKAAFYATLQGARGQSGGTPLRRAMDDVGQYFSRSDALGPWADVPGTGSVSSQLSCRRNFHVLMTDGVWNSDAAPTLAADADVDSSNGQLITGPGSKSYQYAPAPPYAGQGGHTLADVAMYYWNRDLRPDLTNNVLQSRSTDAFWQHMVNYTIAFGVNGNLSNDADLPALINGSKTWGTPAIDAEAANVDDLWHAALNSHGQQKNASNADEYAKALRAILSDIAGRAGSEAGVAVATRSSVAGNYKYVPSYVSGDWYGELIAYPIGGSSATPVWTASQLLPDPSTRNIWTYKDATSKGIQFTAATLTAQGMTPLLNAPDPAALVDYLRGVRGSEGAGMRQRKSVLGDIVNSTPVLVKDLADGQYDFLPTSMPGQSSYRGFLVNKARRVGQIFVGANDGMLHAFDQSTGVETFAYVPRAVLGSVKNLASLSYTHQYFVDGPLVEADVYDASATRWKNLVVGTGGAGAKNLFAINVPVPLTGAAPLTASGVAPASADILWEVDASKPGLSELGNVLHAAELGVARDGSWVAVSGNGYESASGKAQLLILDALTGAVVRVLDTGVGSAASPNGLGGVRVVRDNQQQIVAAYAGDLKGNLWKFDLSSTSPANWAVAFGGNPLVRATNAAGAAEPITAAPAYLLHPAGGVMVLFGSGKLMDTGDAQDLGQRSLYGVWDRVAIGAASANAADRITSNTTLVIQSISSVPLADTAGTFYSISNNTVDYGDAATARKRGWVVRLTIVPGQRQIYEPQAEAGRVFFDTIAPSSATDPCSADDAVGFTFVLDPFTGGPGEDGPTLDTNGDGKFTSADLANAAVMQLSANGRRTIVREAGSPVVQSVGGGVPDANGTSKPDPRVKVPSNLIGRQWQQIVTQPAY
ncbi:MAG: hypothetical protein JSR41_26055 [Proteobacteria bacterium]|nr:hypothetical protein [Pseudomonadota bacterium]